MEYSPLTIAHFFTKKANESKIPWTEYSESMTNLRVQKLIYFAHAYSLSTWMWKLVNESFQAWKFWPVLESLYHYIKDNVWEWDSNINIDVFKDIKKIQPADKTLLSNIRDSFDKFTTKELVEISHEHWPWKDYFQADVRNILIPDKDIEKQFKTIFVD